MKTLTKFWIDTKVENGWISWGSGFVLIVLAGWVVSPWLGA